jgi:hypothetical protein
MIIRRILRERALHSIDARISVVLLAALLPHLKLIASRDAIGKKPRFRSGIASLSSRPRRRELPSKTIAKNIEQIITYPHSDCKRFEKQQPPNAK